MKNSISPNKKQVFFYKKKQMTLRLFQHRLETSSVSIKLDCESPCETQTPRHYNQLTMVEMQIYLPAKDDE